MANALALLVGVLYLTALPSFADDKPEVADPGAEHEKFECLRRSLDLDRWKVACEDRSKGLAMMCDASLEFRCACIHGEQYHWTYGHECADAGIGCFDAPCPAAR